MIEEKQRIHHRCAGRDREAEETEKNPFPDLHSPDSIAAWPGCLALGYSQICEWEKEDMGQEGG